MNVEQVLRGAAAEIRAQNINGWGNACEAGADRIAALDTMADDQRKDSLALMALLAAEKRKSERLDTTLAWHQKVLARAVQFDWLTSAVPEDLAQDVLDCMKGVLISPGSEKNRGVKP